MAIMTLSTIQHQAGLSGTSSPATPVQITTSDQYVQYKLLCTLRFEQELLENWGPRELGVQQYATVTVSHAPRGGGAEHLLEEVLQPHSPCLEKLGPELGYHALWR